MSEKHYYLRISNRKNNTFLTINNYKGALLTYKSLKEKKTKDIKSKLTWGLIFILKKLKHLKIKYINLDFINLNTQNVQHMFILCKTFNLIINNINYKLKLPHNGCRKSRTSRKRNKSRKKNKKIVL